MERAKPFSKRRVYEILSVARKGDRTSWSFDIFLMTLICLNVIGMAMETMPDLPTSGRQLLRGFEIFSITVFSVEYLLRVWTCTENPLFAGAFHGRLRFACSPMALIDLAAILPFYLPMVVVDLRFMRAVRLLRIVRLAKLGRYSDALQTLGRVLWRKKEELVTILFVAMVLLVGASTLMYYAENEAQPDNFSSIPATMWWGVTTLTTVGYGDSYPVTPLGKVLAAIVAVLGIGMFALPTGLLGAAFSEELASRRRTKRLCPHCGEDLDASAKPSVHHVVG